MVRGVTRLTKELRHAPTSFSLLLFGTLSGLALIAACALGMVGGRGLASANANIGTLLAAAARARCDPGSGCT